MDCCYINYWWNESVDRFTLLCVFDGRTVGGGKAMKMKVVLMRQVEGLGKPGDIVEVAGGYARNFLIPRGLALPATEGNIAHAMHMAKVLERKRNKELKTAKKLAEKLANISLTISAKVGEGDRLFGSITSADIAEALAKEGVEVDHRQIMLESPIKSLGVYEVPIKLHPEVIANVKIWVVAQ